MKHYPMTSAQKNIEDVVTVYAGEGVCRMGGFFELDSSMVQQMKYFFGRLPHICSAMSLLYVHHGELAVDDGMEWEVEEYYIKNTPSEELGDLTEEYAHQEIRRWVEQPFPDDGRLCCFAFFYIGNKVYGAEKYHHLIMDRASLMPLVELHREYYSYAKNGGGIEEYFDKKRDGRYIDFMMSSGGVPDKNNGNRAGGVPPEGRKTLKEWITGNFPEKCACPHEMKRGSSAKSESYMRSIDRGIYKKICGFAREKNISRESVFYTAIFTEKCLRCGTEYEVMGRMTENRKKGQSEIIGLFASVMPVPFSIHGTLGDMDKFFYASLRYREYPYAEILKSCGTKRTSYDTLVSWHPSHMVLDENGEYSAFDCGYIETPLRIWIYDTDTEPSIEFFYQKECYREKEIKELAERIVLVITQLTDGVRPEGVSLLADKDKRAYELLNSGGKVYPAMTIPELFEKAARSDPEKIVLWDDRNSFTYKEAYSIHENIKKILIGNHVASNDFVGIHMERSALLPLCMIAVMGTGAAFLPLAVEDSPDRKKILSRECKVVLSDKEYALPNEIVVEISELKSGLAESGIPESREELNSIDKLRGQCAYMLYTSGTTGEPKGVRISMYSLMCRLEWMARNYGMTGTTMQKTRNTFDVSIWELLLPLAYGGRLYVLPHGQERFPEVIAEKIISENIENIHFVPGMLREWLNTVEENKYKFPSLKNIFASGETLLESDVGKVKKLLKTADLHNLYGPTECTIDVTYFDFKGSAGDVHGVPIGRPVANTEIMLISPANNTVLPCGVAGEICVFGDLVGMGCGEAVLGFGDGRRHGYMTGDMAVLSEAGYLYFHGRNDTQKKVRGMRVDMQEICSVINGAALHGNQEKTAEESGGKKGGITDSYACVENNRIIAFYESDREEKWLMAYLSDNLPYYSVPDRLYQVGNFPRNPNGKLDAGELVNFAEKKERHIRECGRGQRERDKEYMKNMQKADMGIVKALCETIGVCIGRDVSPADSLETLQIDSLAAVGIILELKKKKIEVSYDMLYSSMNIAELAARICRKDERPVSVFQDLVSNPADETLLICVPYGGGGAEIYGTLAGCLPGAGMDISVIDDKADSAGTGRVSVRTVVRRAVRELSSPGAKKYSSYIIFGYCAGSAIAVELARQLAEKNFRVGRVFIAASLPGRPIHILGKRMSPWALVPDAVLKGILGKLAGSRAAGSGGMLAKFRRDTDRFFHYMDGVKPIGRSIPFTLIFAEDDILTANWEKKYRKWEYIFGGKADVRVIKKSGHYFDGDAWREIGGYIFPLQYPADL